MFQHLPKFLGILALAVIGCASAPGTSAQDTHPEPSVEKPQSPDTDPPPLSAIPYVMGADYRYTWILDGESFATTTMRFETVKDANGLESLTVRGSLDYDRAGRLLTGSSRLTFTGTDLRRPQEFRGSLETAVPNMGSSLDEILVRFEKDKANWTHRVGPRLERGEAEVESPTWVLESMCFEHWAILSPHLAQITENDELTCFVPTGASPSTYKVQHERSEKSGETVRERWSIGHPNQAALLWTDAEGRLVEYRQEPLQIILTEVRPPKEKQTAAGKAEPSESGESEASGAADGPTSKPGGTQ